MCRTAPDDDARVTRLADRLGDRSGPRLVAGPGTRVPAKNPCGSCPYRCDVPSGVWHPDEYAKLAGYDQPTAEQPPNLFGCHQDDGRLCAGWAGCHDMDNSLAVRLAAVTGQLTGLEVEALLEYRTPVPLFTSGAQAAAHGLREVTRPGPEAEKTMTRLLRKRETRERAPGEQTA